MLAVALRILLAILLLLGLWLTGCGQPPKEVRSAPQEPAAGRKPEPQYSYTQMNDLRATPQLLSGWYPVEDGAWRWMGREAQVMLRAPENPPAQFEVRLAIPRGHLAITGPLTLSVLFNNRPFAEQTYNSEGAFTFTKPVPPGTVSPGAVQVTLRVNKARPPGTGGDLRELGLVILGLGFR